MRIYSLPEAHIQHRRQSLNRDASHLSACDMHYTSIEVTKHNSQLFSECVHKKELYQGVQKAYHLTQKLGSKYCPY